MTDSLDRLYRKILDARDADAPTSRTARLFRRGRPHMAKKLGEEAVEVVIDALAGNADAVVRESADLIYNLAALWADCGIRPADIWAEMDRRERLLGIAEKIPKATGKSGSKQPHSLAAPTLKSESATSLSRRAVAAHGPGNVRKRRLGTFRID